MPKRPIANPLALAVLACLWERPMYPYEMTTTLRERGKDDSIRLNFGSLYSVIKSLEKHGLIAASHTEREGNRPERVVYAITEVGKVETVDWLRELLGRPIKDYPAFEAGLSLLTLLTPVQAVDVLRARLARLQAALDEGHRAKATPEFRRVPPLFLVENDYRLAMLAAEHAFVDALIERIVTDEIGGVEVWARMHESRAAGKPPSEIEADIAAYMAGYAREEGTGPES